MRTKSEIYEFEKIVRRKYIDKCDKCGGIDLKCGCNKKFRIAVGKYEACIPRDFVDIDPKTIKRNKNVFKNIILKYVESINLALKHGYGLLLTGDNGTGKTYFMSYISNKAVESGRTVYYTTLLQLEYLIKCGFSDKEVSNRLSWMLTSDFLILDEVGKEKQTNNKRSYMDTQVERILRQRYDNNFPVLMGTNLSIDGLKKAYGSTIGSMITHKSKIAQMSPGDFRIKLGKKMSEEMGF
jgi:DNA replication protein DnaC